MKKVYRILLCILPTLLFVGCSDSSEGFVRFSENSVVFDTQGGTKSVNVTTYPKGVAWSISCEEQADWLLFEAQDERIVVTVEPNLSDKERQVKLSVSAVGGEFATRELAICQEAGEAPIFITSAEATYEFDSRGGEKSFTVVSNLNWSVESIADWVKIEQNEKIITLSVNEYEGTTERKAEVVVSAGDTTKTIEIVQHTAAQNRYLNLVGKWEITATKWYYTTNGSLNEVGYTPAAEEYCLLFDIEEAEYGKTLTMKNFLYPRTALEVKYNAESGGFVVPFGWPVLSYDVFLYITGISGRQFFYASYEVEVKPEEDSAMLSFAMPSISDCDYVGFGLWTYNDNGGKVAFGYSSRPTMYPMGDIKLVKKSN